MSARVGFISLGCPKATFDSERILSQLRAEGYEISPQYQNAELVVVNTCGFIDTAVAESLDTIGEALAENGKVIVTGCLGASGDIVRKTHPGVLAVSGPEGLDQVMDAVHRHLPRPHDPHVDLLPPGGIKLTPRHYAYLKISEGCNHRCTFCIIPSLRGTLLSRPVGDVLREAEMLVEAGVRELLVISQDTSAYGMDVKYRTGFWNGRPVKTRITELAEALGSLGIWIRLHYVYPYPHVDELVSLMSTGRILPYLDVPFQHANPRILKAMKRPASGEDHLARIRRWREVCPEISIRSTFIVGFPGETQSEYEDLLEFLQAAQLDRVGCFAYSPVAGAKANSLGDALAEDVKQERLERLMLLQEGISAAKLQHKIGSRQTVLVDEINQQGAIARSGTDAPEVDGVVYIDTTAALAAGEFIQVRITGADAHDLYARPV